MVKNELVVKSEQELKDQLKKLDARLGVGIGAVRERAKIVVQLEKLANKDKV